MFFFLFWHSSCQVCKQRLQEEMWEAQRLEQLQEEQRQALQKQRQALQLQDGSKLGCRWSYCLFYFWDSTRGWGWHQNNDWFRCWDLLKMKWIAKFWLYHTCHALPISLPNVEKWENVTLSPLHHLSGLSRLFSLSEGYPIYPVYPVSMYLGIYSMYLILSGLVLSMNRSIYYIHLSFFFLFSFLSNLSICISTDTYLSFSCFWLSIAVMKNQFVWRCRFVQAKSLQELDAVKVPQCWPRAMVTFLKVLRDGHHESPSKLDDTQLWLEHNGR